MGKYKLCTNCYQYKFCISSYPNLGDEDLKKQKYIEEKKLKKQIQDKPKAWNILVKFTEKYLDYFQELKYPEEVKKLMELLKLKYNIDIDFDILTSILYDISVDLGQKEYLRKYEKFKKIILSEKPKLKNDYYDAFLKHYYYDIESEDKFEKSIENLEFLANLLHELKIGAYVLPDEMEERAKVLEIEQFEKSLEKGELKNLSIIKAKVQKWKNQGYNVEELEKMIEEMK